MMTKLGRLLTAMVTPFDEEGGVDYEQTKRLSLALLDSGSDGLVVSGTTGERPTLTDEEQLKLFTTVKEAVGDRGTVMAGTGSNSTDWSTRVNRTSARAVALPPSVSGVPSATIRPRSITATRSARACASSM